MKQIHSLLISLALLVSGSAMAQWTQPPTGGPDSRIERIQAKAESLYERGSYKRAHFIYSNELARKGDKYAQYMTGYMYLMGHGVVEDPVIASAWYRIAAERQAPEFIAVRDQVLQTLDDEKRVRSDELYVHLRREYSDLAIVMEMLVKDLENLSRARTGSRLSSNASSVVIVDPKTGMQMSADHLRNRELRIVQTRLDFVTTRLDIDSIKAERAGQHIDGLWERIEDFLSVVDDEANGLYAAP